MKQLCKGLLLAIALTPIAFSQSVPSEYQDIQTLIASKVAAFAAPLPSNPKDNGLLFAPQSLLAISGRGNALLQSTVMDYGVIPEIDWFKSFGSNAVTIHINFPVLDPAFHAFNGHPENFQKFVDFYARMATECHSRGMKLIVEAIADSASAGTDTADYERYIKTLSWDQWIAGRTTNAVNVATLVKPDYLTVVTEPTTEVFTSGHNEAGTAAGSFQILSAIVDAVAAAAPDVSVGGGAGTWEKDFEVMLGNAISLRNLAFLDVHVYPTNRDFLTRLNTAADIAQAAGKRMMLSEVWTLKVRDEELGRLGTNDQFSRDVFSFWRTTDQAFLSAIVRFAKTRNLIAVSPFWSEQFFADLDYDKYKGYTPSNLLLTEQQAAQTARNGGVFTSTGAYWATLAGKVIVPPVQTDKAPPVPVGITATVSGSTVTIMWQSGGGTTEGYVLLRGTKESNAYPIVNPNGTSATDKPPRKGTWVYAVKARDRYSRRSSDSTPFVSATIR